MVGLIAVIVFFFFVVGLAVGALLVMAIRINLEDRAALRRLNGSVLLHKQPQGSLAGGVRLAACGWAALPPSTTLSSTT